MADSNVLDRMRQDWNERAREDPHYYVAFGRREQDDAEFFATAADVVRGLRAEARHLRPPGQPCPRRPEGSRDRLRAGPHRCAR